MAVILPLLGQSWGNTSEPGGGMGFPGFLRPDCPQQCGIFCYSILGEPVPFCLGCNHRTHHVLVLRKRERCEKRASGCHYPGGDPGRRRAFAQPGKHDAVMLYSVLRFPGGIILIGRMKMYREEWRLEDSPIMNRAQNLQRRRGPADMFSSAGICTVFYPDGSDDHRIVVNQSTSFWDSSL